MRPLMKLSPQYQYRAFCAFETVAINGVGCGTLVFHDQLHSVSPHPALYDYWFSAGIPQTGSEHLMCYMIAAWLAVAGVLQCSINFDAHVPVRTKKVALYTFALCDLAWIFLMVNFSVYFSPYHLVGSAFTILQRTRFWLPGIGDSPFQPCVETIDKTSPSSTKDDSTKQDSPLR